jgi:nucleotide-binding universal stress UspA family protein
MSKKILIPLDGSEMGETALRYFESLIDGLAAGERVEVTLFQVVKRETHEVHPSAGGEAVHVPYTEEEMKQIEEKTIQYLNKAGEGLMSKGATVNCRVARCERNVSSAVKIIEAEEETNADLVAMSTHGRHGLSRWAFGSVSEKVLRGGKVPVLMVRVTT